MTQLMDVPAGLKGVAVTKTSLGDVRGDEGYYHYRQYHAPDLARMSSFEDVWHLMHAGDLPGSAQREDFARRAAAQRALAPRVAAALPAIADLTDRARPLQALRAAYELVALGQGMKPWLDIPAGELRDQARGAVAVFPTLVAALHRLSRGQSPVEPRDDLGHVANYLYMLDGTAPDPSRVRALETYLILTIDHGFSASTFAGRVVASTGADLGSAVIAALGALSGPLHGGAPSRVLDMLDEIGTPDRAGTWVAGRLDRGEVIMGFGHAVYRTADPRDTLLREVARDLGSPRIELARAVEDSVRAAFAERKPGTAINPNVELYAAIIMEAAGLPRELLTPTFAVSRVVGWTAHILEQSAHNKIIRPGARYTGPEPRGTS